MRRRFLALTTVLAGAFAAFHLPFLPRSLEDLDSINFALGMRRFDVAHHQPHPPGYPLFILLARIVNVVVAHEAAALAVLSIAAGSAGAIAIVGLHRRMFARAWTWSIAAGALAVTSPLYWLAASRPLSDMTGLAAAIAVQATTLGARSLDGLLFASFSAGLATGIRSQVFWLTAPLLIWALTRDGPPGVGATRRWTSVGGVFLGGVLLWLVPLVLVSGGARAYWQALASQGGEDLSGIQMLWTTPTLRTLRDALYYAFVAPWAVWPIAAVVLVACAGGVIVLWRSERRQGEALAVAFVPYLLFDILFQETFTIRYALPLVVPMAFLAARGLQVLPARPAFVALGALVMWNAHVGGRSVASLGSDAAPVFRLLHDMKSADGTAPVLAPDRRQSFDLRRPLVWVGGDAPRFERQLSAPPQHEWLEAVNYWNDGGRAPVWFVVDPRRAAIDLIQHAGATRYRWPVPYPVLMSGTRPNDADWYQVERPDWYVGEGWALTPESAGVAERDRRGLQYGGIDAWARRSALGRGTLLIGGRDFEPSGKTTISVAIGSAWSTTIAAAPGGFLELVSLPFDRSDPPAPDFVKLTVTAQPPARAAIEQFDVAPASRGTVGYGTGWHERELDVRTGRQWRWLSGRGELRYVAPAGWRLHIEGESPLRYYSRQSRLVFRSADRVLRDATVAADFSIDVDLPEAREPSTISVETDQTHVPADAWWRRTADRRRLGLRIFRCELLPH